MKIFTYFFFLYSYLFCFQATEAQNCNCDFTIPLNTTTINGTSLGVQPGDTICLLAGQRTFLYFKNIIGDSLHPVVIINKDGAVNVMNTTYSYGIRVAQSRYFRFTGTGVDSIKHGIKILQTAPNCNGLSLDNLATNFEIDHFEIANTGFAGINSKTQPTCDGTANRGVFTQYSVSIHDNYIHDTGGEGMYIGHSFYNGYCQTCNGVPDTLYPHDIIGMRIYNNIIENAHWDGMQVGCVVEDCEIYNNVITNYGIDKVTSQNAGLQIGGGTTGKCYNNFVANGSGIGINVFGTGNNFVYNNIVLNAGQNYFPNDPSKFVHGIFCADRSTVPGSPFNFINNTIINPKTDGIRMTSTLSANNEIRNNIVVHPGSMGSYSNPNTSYVNLMTTAPTFVSNNYYAPTAAEVQFRDTLNMNYRVLGTSPVKDAGIDVSSMGVIIDYDSLLRLNYGSYDIGAFEYHPENIWTGAKSSLWNDPANWSEQSTPIAEDHVIIPGGTPFVPEILSGTYICNHLIIDAGAEFTMHPDASLTIMGNLTIQSGGILTNNGMISLKGNLANLN